MGRPTGAPPPSTGGKGGPQPQPSPGYKGDSVYNKGGSHPLATPDIFNRVERDGWSPTRLPPGITDPSQMPVRPGGWGNPTAPVANPFMPRPTEPPPKIQGLIDRGVGLRTRDQKATDPSGKFARNKKWGGRELSHSEAQARRKARRGGRGSKAMKAWGNYKRQNWR